MSEDTSREEGGVNNSCGAVLAPLPPREVRKPGLNGFGERGKVGVVARGAMGWGALVAGLVICGVICGGSGYFILCLAGNLRCESVDYVSPVSDSVLAVGEIEGLDRTRARARKQGGRGIAGVRGPRAIDSIWSWRKFCIAHG